MPSVEAVAQHYEAHGYFHVAARSQAHTVLALRFNLEMTRDNRFGIAVADREDMAVEQAHAAPAPQKKRRRRRRKLAATQVHSTLFGM